VFGSVPLRGRLVWGESVPGGHSRVESGSRKKEVGKAGAPAAREKKWRVGRTKGGQIIWLVGWISAGYQGGQRPREGENVTGKSKKGGGKQQTERRLIR